MAEFSYNVGINILMRALPVAAMSAFGVAIAKVFTNVKNLNLALAASEKQVRNLRAQYAMMQQYNIARPPGFMVGLTEAEAYNAQLKTQLAQAQAMRQLAIGGGLFLVGAEGISMFVRAAEAAGNYQQELMNVQLVSHATTLQMRELNTEIVTLTGRFGFAATDLAEGFAAVTKRFPAATALAIFPQMVAVGRILSTRFGAEALPQITGDISGLLFDMGLKTPEQISKVLPLITGAALAAPGDTTALMHMLRYGAAAITGLGMDPMSALILAIQGARMTGGGMWAGFFSPASLARMQNFFEKAITAGGFGLKPQERVAARMLGLTPDIVSQMWVGGFKPELLQNILQTRARQLTTLPEQRQFVRDLLKAEGAAGVGVKTIQSHALLMADLMKRKTPVPVQELLMPFLQTALGPSAAGIGLFMAMHGIDFPGTRKDIEAGQDVAGESAKAMSTLNASISAFHASLGMLEIEIGQHILPTLTKVIQTVTGWIRALNQFIDQNPGLTKTLVTVGGVIAGLMVVGGILLGTAGALGLLNLSLQSMGIQSAAIRIAVTALMFPLRLLGAGLTSLFGAGSAILAALGPAGWLVLGLTAAAGIAYWIYLHNKNALDEARRRGGPIHTPAGLLVATGSDSRTVFERLSPQLRHQFHPGGIAEGVTSTKGGLNITMHVHQTPGENMEQFAKKVLEQITHWYSISILGATTGQGMNQSPAFTGTWF